MLLPKPPMKDSHFFLVASILMWLCSGMASDSLLDDYKFVETCDTSAYHLTSPKSSFPLHIDTLSFDPDFVDIKKWYDIGLKECNSYIELHGKELLTSAVSNALGHHPPRSKVNTCRGNELLYQATGLLVWAFGPISKCPPYSKCDLNQGKIEQLYSEDYANYVNGYFQDGYTGKPAFNGWTISSLHIDTRLVGHETVVPKMQYTTFPMATNRPVERVEVLISEYILTVPGTYHLEMRLQGLYLGKMFNWTPKHIEEGALALQSIFLGGCEPRCPPNFNCGPFNLPVCDAKSFVINSPFIVNSSYHGKHAYACHKNVKKLPYCTNGNHPGRWLEIPKSVLDTCQVETFMKEWNNEMNRLKGKRMVYDGLIAVRSRFNEHCQKTSSETMWASVMNHNPSSQHHSLSDKDMYIQELKRYADGSICTLASIARTDLVAESSLALWAPYDCKYRIFSRNEALSCLKKNNLRHIAFNGDSMSRDLFGEFMEQLGISELTAQQLKAMSNEGMQNKTISQSGRGVVLSDMYTWNGFDDSVMKAISPPHYPDAFITNFAQVHSFSSNLITYRNKANTSMLADFWRQHARRYSTKRVVKIFQSMSALHGKRNGGYTWMNEFFRTHNNEMRDVFINELGFLDFDEWVTTAGLPDHTDGWHYAGTQLKMNGMILTNMLCNAN